MTVAVVVDASVAVKWVIEEDLMEQAEALLDDSNHSAIRMFAPPLLLGEVTNGVYQNERRGNIGPAEATAALAKFSNAPVELMVFPNLYANAFAFARQHKLKATYDSQYAVLANVIGADLWTADRAFIRSLPRSVTHVRWLGDYQPA